MTMKKRKRTALEGDDNARSSSDSGGANKRRGGRRPSANPLRDEADSTTTSDAEAEGEGPRTHNSYKTLSQVSICGPEFPRSQYKGWIPPLEPDTEPDALLHLKQAFLRQEAFEEDPSDYVWFSLDDFTIYRPADRRPTFANQLSSLDRLKNRGGFDEFLFDGVLSVGNERRFVQGVLFDILAIDGYRDEDVHDMTEHICIQSRVGASEDVWYKLREPAKEYHRFYDPFSWLAQFTKYFADYLFEHKAVELEDFRYDFYGYLYSRYSELPSFRSWHAKCNLRDFRTTVAANVGFLWKECRGIDDEKTRLYKHPIWREIDGQQLTAIPREPQEEVKTVVTPFVYSCFKHMYFGDYLQIHHILDDNVRAAVARRKRTLGLTPLVERNKDTGLLTPRSMQNEEQSFTDVASVTEGNVICVQPDTQGRWKPDSSVWYAYVQRVREDKDGTKLDVIWLYEPHDTTLGKARYVHSNELFFSDNCSCGKDAIDLGLVLRKEEVSFFAKDPNACDGFCVRRKFRTVHDEDTYDFVSLTKSDFRCSCKTHTPIFDDCRLKYQIGETVLYKMYHTTTNEGRLEPGQIVDFLLSQQRVKVRKLARSVESNPKAKSNELLLTTDVLERSASHIIRHCDVRFFHSDVVEEGLPIPYSRDGAGDHFFILSDDSLFRLNSTTSLSMDELVDDSGEPLTFPPIAEGWDPAQEGSHEKLHGMGIFCGGGNLDRGLEEGGSVEFDYAIDIDSHALHTYRANDKRQDHTQYFLGSVDDYLAQAIAGSNRKVIAQVGDVELLAAGSPCPGFSRMNMMKMDPQALRNSSMVASVISYVDFYSPEYLVLENVVPMTQGMGPDKKDNVFAQIIAALVALGYQVQQSLMDSWSFGSPQSRTRVFIIASAPGLEPLAPPTLTHDHPRGKRWMQAKLGTSSNGLPFGRRRDDFTPFDHVSPALATSDLPDVGDSLPQLCLQFPDHRTPSEQDSLTRSCFAVVPTHPRGMGFVDAIRQGKQSDSKRGAHWCSAITGKPADWYEEKLKPSKTRNKEGSKVYARLYPDGLFPTLLTNLHTNDGINGRSLHWDQPRTLTVMEGKRAQGYHDEEVLVGNPGQQWRILGNSVDRSVSLVLGLALRRSRLKQILDCASVHPSSGRAEATPDFFSGVDLETTQQATTLRPCTAKALATEFVSEPASDTEPTQNQKPGGLLRTAYVLVQRATRSVTPRSS